MPPDVDQSEAPQSEAPQSEMLQAEQPGASVAASTNAGHVARLEARRSFLQSAAAGSLVTLFGGAAFFLDDGMTRGARAAERSDGRPRLPPGQRVVSALRPMGGTPGDPRRSHFKLKVHGDVHTPFELDFQGLLMLPQVSQTSDIHCVTSWSMLDAKFLGVRVSELAKRAGLKAGVRHCIFEAAADYTSNVRIDEALGPNVLVAHTLADSPLPRTHGGPVRALVPDLYFWKSAKWLRGIRFVRKDEPGYWETRGYHNHADPWKEERYA